MMRIFVFLLPSILFLAACVSPDAGEASGCAVQNRKAVVSSQQINCRVLEFSFCDARSDVKKRIMIGPFRILGTAEEYICSLLLPPFGSLTNSFSPFYPDGIIDASVTMYSDKQGFFAEHPPCWRLRVVAPATVEIENIILEVNYSYCFDNGSGSGIVKAMQRLPLRSMDVTTFSTGRNLCEKILYKSDESVPFSIVCVCYILSKRTFSPVQCL